MKTSNAEIINDSSKDSIPNPNHVIFEIRLPDVVSYLHGQGGFPSPGGPPCLAHARYSLG